MDVEGMGFKGAVFYGPVFDRAHFRRDDGLFVGFEDSLLLSVHSNVELDGAVGAAKFLREITVFAVQWGLLGEVEELDSSGRGSTWASA